MDYLDILEAEAIYILREVAAQFKKPVLLFSGGKDSTLLIHLAIKAFYPNKPPFPIMHIDTGYNFEETLQFRNKLINKYGLTLIISKVEDTIHKRGLAEPLGKFPSRNALQSQTLLDAIDEFGFDACIGGGRRDEEKARAKERIFSIRDISGGWQPYNQRPELWDLYNGNIHERQNVRIFPISNWSELDVWNYIRSSIRVRNNDMILLGGLEEKNNNNSSKGLPILSRIPILKWIFSSRSVNNTKSKLAILIHPTVIY